MFILHKYNPSVTQWGTRIRCDLGRIDRTDPSFRWYTIIYIWLYMYTYHHYLLPIFQKCHSSKRKSEQCHEHVQVENRIRRDAKQLVKHGQNNNWPVLGDEQFRKKLEPTGSTISFLSQYLVINPTSYSWCWPPCRKTMNNIFCG